MRKRRKKIRRERGKGRCEGVRKAKTVEGRKNKDEKE